jgi:hypothetical protein
MLNPGPQAGAPASEGAARVGGEPPSFQCPHCDRVLTTLTISWRGVWSSESARSLRELGLTDRELAQYSTYALRGSWMNWVRFGASTSIRMGRGRP